MGRTQVAAEQLGLRFVWGIERIRSASGRTRRSSRRASATAGSCRDDAGRRPAPGRLRPARARRRRLRRQGDPDVRSSCSATCRSLLALSTNSPLWCGRDTGMASYRSQIMEALPTAGLPHDAAQLVGVRRGSSNTLRLDGLHQDASARSGGTCARTPDFGTVELRIMDHAAERSRHVLGLVVARRSRWSRPSRRTSTRARTSTTATR